ncbi:MAG: flippase-like domain-containing protein [Deltaproteobacteria bacterium]|nr:flippase-like domain-containing protein [Deltaproteobacteria bacterium]
MAKTSRLRWQHILPWIVSAGLLFYVFTVVTDWDRLRAATEQANLPLFLAFTIADRTAFFVVWSLLQAVALRRFVAQVPIHSIIAIRGGSELLRAVSNPLSDGAFFLGLGQLTGGRLEAVLAAALVPTICHFLILALQMTVALPFLPGSFDANRDVFITVIVTWVIVLVLAIGVRISAKGSTRIPGARRVRSWLERFPLSEIRPFFIGFLALAIFDILIQGLASRAFGVDIPWTALAARIPLLYLALVVPSLGNFGTRELAWAGLFSEFGSRDALIAYAFSVNSVFLILNVLIGIIFLKRALQLVGEVRRARKTGEPAPAPLLRDPSDG